MIGSSEHILLVHIDMCSASVEVKTWYSETEFIPHFLSLALCCLGPHSAILLQISGSVGKNHR